MKNIILLAAIVLSVSVQAQLPNIWTTATTVSSTSATPVYFTFDDIVFEIGNEFTVGGTCTQVSGTSEGTITLEGSMTGATGTYFTVNQSTDTDFVCNDNDTVTVVNGKDFMFYMPKTKLPYYRLNFTGGASDATNFVPVWQYKR